MLLLHFFYRITNNVFFQCANIIQIIIISGLHVHACIVINIYGPINN